MFVMVGIGYELAINGAKLHVINSLMQILKGAVQVHHSVLIIEMMEVRSEY